MGFAASRQRFFLTSSLSTGERVGYSGCSVFIVSSILSTSCTFLILVDSCRSDVPPDTFLNSSRSLSVSTLSICSSRVPRVLKVSSDMSPVTTASSSDLNETVGFTSPPHFFLAAHLSDLVTPTASTITYPNLGVLADGEACFRLSKSIVLLALPSICS